MQIALFVVGQLGQSITPAGKLSSLSPIQMALFWGRVIFHLTGLSWTNTQVQKSHKLEVMLIQANVRGSL